jgi:hypothetical protein
MGEQGPTGTSLKPREQNTLRHVETVWLVGLATLTDARISGILACVSGKRGAPALASSTEQARCQPHD